MTATERPTVKCECCGGAGKQPLSDELWAALVFIRRSGEPVMAKTIRGVMHRLSQDLGRPMLTALTVSNRLAKLLELRLVTRERSGKFWLYSAR